MADANSLQLNKEQKLAVRHTEGPLLIIAGAGTGKTTVVTERIKYLILKKRVNPSEVLALTFTEKAAREMEERVDVAMPYGYTQMWISTFHSFCDRVLRDEALQIGLDPKYHLMTEAEAIRFLREHIFKLDLRYFRPLGNPTKFVAGLLQHFSRLKDEDVEPTDYVRWAKNSKFPGLAKRSGAGQIPNSKIEREKWVELAGAYRKYEELKVKEGVMDFSDLISNTLKLFRQRPNVLRQYKRKFKYILVDEFQDTNIAQNELVELLAGRKGNITVVCDDDQAIYRWRGAAVSNVTQFRKSFPKTRIVTLTQNYRSTQIILDNAYKLIQNNNPDRLEVTEKIKKKLVSVGSRVGEPPDFIHTDRVENEADAVVKKILQLTEEKRQFSDFAILVRANAHSEPFVRALSRAGVPYQFLGPGQLFKKEEVKEIFAYLKVLYNFEDSLAFYKVLSMEHFALSGRDLAAITNYARRLNSSLFEAAERIKDVFVSEGARDRIQRIVEMVHKHLKLVPKHSAGQIAYYFLEDAGLLKNMINAKTAREEKRAQNLARFFDKLKTYEVEHEDASVFVIVDWIELSLELGESPLASDFDWTKENAVNILTVHSSKGLEFPVVFVVNCVSERFPTRERREQIPIPDELIKEILPSGDYHLQEERRLFYVAMTRAQDRLYLAASDYYGEGRREKKISPFVVEALSEDAIRKTQDVESEQLSILDFAPATNESRVTSYELPKINYLSYSQIDTFRFCPLHYKLRYILRIPTPPTASQSFGTSLHATLRDFYKGLIRREFTLKSQKDKILEFYEKNWIREGYSSKAHESRMKKRGKEYLLDYLKSDLYKPRNLPLALEQPFTFPLTPSLRIGGRIDRVDKTREGLEIIDYKTTDFLNRELPDEKDLKHDLQLSVYAMAANKVNHPLFSKDPDEVTLSLYFFDKGVKVSTTRTSQELEKAAQEILKIKEQIEASDFSCSGNFWCKDCEFKLFCEGA